MVFSRWQIRALRCDAVVVSISFVALLGYSTHHLELASYGGSYIPMALSSALIFLNQVAAQICWMLHPWASFSKRFSLVSSFGVLLFCGLAFFSHSILYTQIEELFGRVSPLAYLNFVLFSITLLLFSFKKRPEISTFLCFLGACWSSVLLLGYLYGTETLYGGHLIPIALPTAINFLFLFLGMLFRYGPNYFPIRIFTGDTSRAKLWRAFLPYSLFSVIAHGFVFRITIHYFQINLALFSVLSAITFMAVVLAIVMAVSHSIGEKLDEASNTSENLSRLKSDFINNMSHELRTPLNGVIGMSEILIPTAANPDQETKILAIHDSGLRLLQLLDDIISFSVTDSKGLLPLEIHKFNLRECVKSSIYGFENSAAKKKLSFSYTVEPGLASDYIGDKRLFSRLLFHLIDNALKFTETGEVKALISKDTLINSKACVRIEVQDTGVGISPANQEHLFDLFYQGDSTASRSTGGTGLGLALCKRIVESMEGEINLESLENKGTRVWAKLPFLPAPVIEPAVRAQQLFPKKGARILVAEDDQSNQIVTSSMLTHLGFEYSLAENGEETIQLYEKGGFDLILMDCQMPKLDGLVATALIRKKESVTGGRIPIIALTSHVGANPKKMCFDAGMDDFLSKPIRMNVLNDAIKRWLS